MEDNLKFWGAMDKLGYNILAGLGSLFQLKQEDNQSDNSIMPPIISASPYSTFSNRISESDYIKQIKANIGYTFTCTNINGNAVGKVPFHLMRRITDSRSERRSPLLRTTKVDKKVQDFIFSQSIYQKYVRGATTVEEIIEHPALSLLDGVNAFSGNFELKSTSSKFLDLTGCCYWYVLKDSFGVPEDIWMIFPQWMKPIPGKENIIDGYKFVKGKHEVFFDPDEIVYFRVPSLLNEITGSGAVAAIYGAHNLYQNMQDYESTMFSNMGQLSLAMFIREGGLSSEMKQAYEAALRQTFGGHKKSGKIGVFPNEIDIKEFGTKPREMSYGMGRKTMREEICAALGVPVGMVTSESAYRTNTREARIMHAANFTEPRVTLMIEKLNDSLLPMWPEYDGTYFFMVKDVVPEDDEIEIKRNTAYVESGIKLINEVRADSGIGGPIPGGDSIWKPASEVPIGPTSENNNTEMLARALIPLVKEKLREKIT